MTFFNEIASAAAEAADVFGHDEFVATPMIHAAHGNPEPDPARSAFAFKGQFDADPELSASGGGRAVRPDTEQKRSSGKFLITAFSAAWPHALRNGDRITRTKTGEKFTVATTMPDGRGHVALTLNRAK